MKTYFLKQAILVLAFSSVTLLSSCEKDEEPGINEVFMNDNTFTPSSITVPTGTIITWINKENAVHTVTSNSGVFNSGDLGEDKSFMFTFNNPGTYPYHCKHHNGMNGTVIVE